MAPVMYFLLAVLAVVLLAIFGLMRTAAAAERAKPPPATPPVTAVTVKGLDKAELQRLLATVAQAPAPPAVAKHADCYSSSGPPETANYVCPVCWHKTLYTAHPLARSENRAHITSNDVVDARQVLRQYLPNYPAQSDEALRVSLYEGRNEGFLRLIHYDLRIARRLARVIRDLSPSIVLDESTLCRRCSPNAFNPGLRLRVAFGDGSIHVTEDVSFRDLILLRALLEGKRSVPGALDGELTPMKSHLPRLYELLGIPPPATNAPTLNTGN